MLYEKKNNTLTWLELVGYDEQQRVVRLTERFDFIKRYLPIFTEEGYTIIFNFLKHDIGEVYPSGVNIGHRRVTFKEGKLGFGESHPDVNDS